MENDGLHKKETQECGSPLVCLLRDRVPTSTEINLLSYFYLSDQDSDQSHAARAVSANQTRAMPFKMAAAMKLNISWSLWTSWTSGLSTSSPQLHLNYRRVSTRPVCTRPVCTRPRFTILRESLHQTSPSSGSHSTTSHHHHRSPPSSRPGNDHDHDLAYCFQI